MHPATLDMLDVLKLFIIPVGGGIPGGVMLAQAKGLAWPVTAALYLVSDLLLALAFEPILRLIAAICSRFAIFDRFRAAFKLAMDRSAAHFSGTGAGPVALVMIAFGVDPMTGRASALAAGHGWVAGWAFAIAGDMLYFAVIAITTLRLNAYLRNPNVTMLIVLAAMLLTPLLIRSVRRVRQPATEG